MQYRPSFSGTLYYIWLTNLSDRLPSSFFFSLLHYDHVIYSLKSQTKNHIKGKKSDARGRSLAFKSRSLTTGTPLFGTWHLSQPRYLLMAVAAAGVFNGVTRAVLVLKCVWRPPWRAIANNNGSNKAFKNNLLGTLWSWHTRGRLSSKKRLKNEKK